MNSNARVFIWAYLAEPVVWLVIAIALKEGFTIGGVVSAVAAGDDDCDCAADISVTLVLCCPCVLETV